MREGINIWSLIGIKPNKVLTNILVPYYEQSYKLLYHRLYDKEGSILCTGSSLPLT